MRRKKRAFFANDEEYFILKAAAKRRSVSEYVLSCALAEAKRHPPIEDLSKYIRQIVREELKDLIPAPGNGSKSVLKPGSQPYKKPMTQCGKCGTFMFAQKAILKEDPNGATYQAYEYKCTSCGNIFHEDVAIALGRGERL